MLTNLIHNYTGCISLCATLTYISHKHRHITTIEYNFEWDLQTLHLKTPICARILISKDRLAVFTNYPNVTKDQALGKTVLTFFFYPVVHAGGFQLISV